MTDSTLIRQHFKEAVVSKCEENECAFNLVDIRNHTILKGEVVRKLLSDKQCFPKESPICDYIIFKFNGTPVVLLVELKKANDAKRIPGQLNGGARAALKLIEVFGGKHQQFVFIPVALKKGWGTIEKRFMEKHPVKINREQCNIVVKGCGFKMKDVLNSRKLQPFKKVINV